MFMLIKWQVTTKPANFCILLKIMNISNES